MSPTADSPTNTDSTSTTTDSQNTTLSDNSSSSSVKVNPQKPLHVETSSAKEKSAKATTPESKVSPPIKNNPPPLPNLNVPSTSGSSRHANPYVTSPNSSSSNSTDGYRTLLNRLTMGLIDWLKFHPNVTSVKVSDFKRAEKSDFVSWEQKHMCILPDDLKAFYSTLNGVSLSWSISMTNLTPGGLNFNQGEGRLPSEKDQILVGLMNVNPLNKLTRVAGSYDSGDYGISLADIDSDDDMFTPTADPKDASQPNAHFVRPKCPKFNERSRIFELDYVEKLKARVCLVYKNTRNEMPAGPNPEIWLLDRSLSWHFIANDFTTFFRLMVVHLGLQEWQLLFSNIPVSSKARQWFNFFAPTRLLLSSHHYNACNQTGDTSDKCNPNALFETPVVQNKFDPGKVFKAKSVRIGNKMSSGSSSNQPTSNTSQNAQRKKQDPKAGAQSTTPASGTSQSNSKGANNSQRAASAGNTRRS